MGSLSGAPYFSVLCYSCRSDRYDGFGLNLNPEDRPGDPVREIRRVVALAEEHVRDNPGHRVDLTIDGTVTFNPEPEE